MFTKSLHRDKRADFRGDDMDFSLAACVFPASREECIWGCLDAPLSQILALTEGLIFDSFLKHIIARGDIATGFGCQSQGRKDKTEHL